MASGDAKLAILIWSIFQLKKKVAQTVGKLIYVEVAPAARLCFLSPETTTTVHSTSKISEQMTTMTVPLWRKVIEEGVTCISTHITEFHFAKRQLRQRINFSLNC